MAMETLADQIEKWDKFSEIWLTLEPGIRDVLKQVKTVGGLEPMKKAIQEL
jgi:hypothetical protein